MSRYPEDPNWTEFNERVIRSYETHLGPIKYEILSDSSQSQWRYKIGDEELSDWTSFVDCLTKCRYDYHARLLLMRAAFPDR